MISFIMLLARLLNRDPYRIPTSEEVEAYRRKQTDRLGVLLLRVGDTLIQKCLSCVAGYEYQQHNDSNHASSRAGTRKSGATYSQSASE